MKHSRRGAFLLAVLVGLFMAAGATTRTVAATTYPPEWDALDGQGLIDLAKELAEEGEAGHDDRLLLVAFLQATHLKDAEAVRGLTCRHWREIVWNLRSTLSAQDKDHWSNAIWDAYADTEERLLQRSGDEIAHLARVVGNYLGNTRIAPSIAAYVVQRDGWESLNLFELDWLAFMAWRAGGLGNDAKERLGAHLTATQFTDIGKIRSAGVKCWKWFTFYLSGALSSDVREAWALGLCQAFAGSPEVAASLDAEGAQRLHEALKTLCQELPPASRKTFATRLKAAFAKNDDAVAQLSGTAVRSLTDALSVMDRCDAGDLALKWLQSHPGWATATAKDLVTLASIGTEGDPEAMAPLLDPLEQAWIVADDQQPLSLSTVYRIMQTWLRTGNREKAQTWVMRAYNARFGTESGRNAVDVVSLGRIAEYLQIVGLTGQGKGYAGFATALARHGREGTLADALAKYKPRTYWGPCDPALLALPLGTPETRQTLRVELLDTGEVPRVAVAKVLSVAYQAAGEHDAWVAFIDQQAEAAQQNPEAASRWLLVRAGAEAARSDPPANLRGKDWLLTVLASSPEASVRCEALRDVVNAYINARRYDQALAFLSEVDDPFARPETQECHTALQAKVESAKAQEALQAKRAHERAAALHRAELKRRLADARARGDAEAVSRYERLIGDSN